MKKELRAILFQARSCRTGFAIMNGCRNFLGLSLLAVFIQYEVNGQALEPRLYSNAPTGLNFVIGGYGFSTGAALADPTVNLQDGELEVHTPFMAYARSFGLWGRSAKFDVVIPYSFLSGSAIVDGVYRTREVEGFADPSLRVSMNFIGAPALELNDFMAYKQDFVLGGSFQIIPPLGQYDSSRLVNIGVNRWTFKPEIGASKTIGPAVLEMATAVALFTDNTDYNNGQTKSQEPLYSVQGHLIYTFPKGIWAAIGGTYYAGGRSEINGSERQDRQENTRIGLTLALPVNKKHSLKLYTSSGVYTRVGSDFDTVGVAWQYRWGGGL